MNETYILDESGNPVEVTDSRTWKRWFLVNQEKRRVAADEIGGSRISTVFMGIDHQWGDGPPLLYETMIFGGPHDRFQDRCSTRAEALEMHERAKTMVLGQAH